MKLCECGCGQEVRYSHHRFIYGHAVRCQSKETRRKQAESVRGFKHTEEAKHKISEGNKGNKGNKGRKLSEEHKKKISESNKGRKASEETKQKMSESQKGRIITEETKRKMSESNKGRTGQTCSEETKRKLSIANTGKKRSNETKRKISESNKGEKCSNWKGGISFEPYCHKFNNTLKEEVRNRDNRICQNCKAKENVRRHTVHHVHYDKSNCYPDLITLCTSCNVKANYNRNYWEIFFMNKLNDRELLFWTRRNGT